MSLRLLPWAPEYGSGLQAEPDPASAGPAPEVDAAIEGPWTPRSPRAEPPAVVQIVDGVRRVEAHAIEDLASGDSAFGLFGSYAVGAVRCEAGRAHIPGGERELRVRRRYLQAGGSASADAGISADTGFSTDTAISTDTATDVGVRPGDLADREVRAGNTVLRFRAERAARAGVPNDLVAALNRLMLDEEARLAEELSEDATALTIVDGPLRLRAPGPRVVGYIKRTYRWYLGPTELALLERLAVGQRTPLFHISEGSSEVVRIPRERLAWYLRIADLGRQFHHLAGVVRLEVPGGLPVAAAAVLADQTALALPRLASSPVRDPRAPQNLTPVGALEDVLTRRLGDRRWIRRQIGAAMHRAVGEAGDGEGIEDIEDGDGSEHGQPLGAAAGAATGGARW